MKNNQTFDSYNPPPQRQTRNSSSATLQIKTELSSGGLPHIHKTKFKSKLQQLTGFKQHNTQKQHIKYYDRYEWLGEQIDYDVETDENIIEENKKLKKILIQINTQLESVVKRVVKPSKIRVKTMNDNTVTLKLRQKQIENNRSIIGLCRKQFRTLQKQKSHIKQNGRQYVENSIEKAKINLKRVKKQNISLKEKNITLGNSIIGTDSMLSGMRQLEQDVIAYEKRKNRLQQNNIQIEQQLHNLNLKLTNIQPKHQSAQSYFSQQSKLNTANTLNIKYQHKLTNNEHNKQLINRKANFMKQNYQKLYHAKLKELQTTVESVAQIGSQIQIRQRECQEACGEVKRLQEKLREIRNKSRNIAILNISDLYGRKQNQKQKNQDKVFVKNITENILMPKSSQKKFDSNKHVQTEYNKRKQYEDQPFQVSSNISSILQNQNQKDDNKKQLTNRINKKQADAQS